jgi:cobalt-zinc-cadmium efflux system outer membrane protein
MTTLLLLAALQAGTDTLRLSVADALQRAMVQPSHVQAAIARDSAARNGIRTARAWYNPIFNITGENLGAQEQVTGKTGFEGVEGQATLQQLLTIGGDRGAMVREAEALAGVSDAGVLAARADLLVGTVASMAVATRDARLARNAAEEAATLAQLATAMTRRAEEGRSSGGEASRVRLELATMRSQAARRGAVAAESGAELARRLGVPHGQAVAIDWPRCASAPSDSAAAGPVPELLAAGHQVDAARAAADRARAWRIPDVAPIAGVRRTAGYTGLLVGLSMELPIMRSGAAAQATARFQADAAKAQLAELEQRLQAQRAGTDSALATLAAAGVAFDTALVADLDRAVRAQQARLVQGEGTIAELLDARRARVNTLNEYAEWRAMRAELRARQARLAGRPVTEQALCEDLVLDLEMR